MEREQIIKALECCITDSCFSCPYDDVGVYSQCVPTLLENALALIKELTEEYDSMAKSVNEASELIRKLRADKKELTEEKYDIECSYNSLKKDNERLHATCTEFERKCASLNEVNERLTRIIAEATKNAKEHSKTLEVVHNEIRELKPLVETFRVDIIREMQEKLKEWFGDDLQRLYSNYNIHRYIDRVTKEMLGGKQ